MTSRAASQPKDRLTLTPSTVFETALEIADRDGLENLTIRKLGSALDVAPMTLYRFFESKEELLDRIADQAVDRFEVPSITSDDWRRQVAEVMIALRQLLLRHPSLVRLLATRRVVSVGLTRSIEATLSHLIGAGFTREQSVKAYSALLAFVLGWVVFEIPRSGPPGHQAIQDDEVVQRLLEFAATREFPLVATSATELAGMAHLDGFEHGLMSLINGLELNLEER